MPTSPKTTSSSVKPRRKPARKVKPAAKKATARPATTRAKASRTRAARQTQAAASQTTQATRDTATVVGDYAERAALIQLGLALTARDRVVSSVSDALSIYSSPKRTQAQLRRFERRGVTARNRLEREVRKARVRVERELRHRRRGIESTVNDLDARRESVAKNGSEIAGRVQERILNLV